MLEFEIPFPQRDIHIRSTYNSLSISSAASRPTTFLDRERHERNCTAPLPPGGQSHRSLCL